MKTSIKQALFSRSFLIGVIGIAVAIGVGSIQTITEALRTEGLLEYNFHSTLILSALSSNALTLVLPIAASLPYTASFIEDMKSGFLKEYLPRTTLKKYISGKIAAAALSGGLVLFVGLIAAYALSALAFAPMEGMPGEEMAEEPYLAQFISQAFLVFFSGALWSMIGLALSSATGSKYMAFASPFILYYVLIILKERYFHSLYVLYPKEWINPSGYWPLGWLGVILLLLELTGLAAVCFALVAKRRIAEI